MLGVMGAVDEQHWGTVTLKERACMLTYIATLAGHPRADRDYPRGGGGALMFYARLDGYTIHQVTTVHVSGTGATSTRC